MDWDAKVAAAGDCVFFDWYLAYAHLAPHLTPVLAAYGSECEIFIPGCGISDVGFELYTNGYHNITNVDISAVAIGRMQQAQVARNAVDAMEFHCLDVLEVPNLVPPNLFDVVFDKGLMDALLCNLKTNVEDTFAYLAGMYQLLRRGGTFVLVTHSATRLCYLEHPTFAWKVIRQGVVDRNGRAYHLFFCVKS
ncbi:hypothetical protein ACHHYP_15388 [Achlya hypogyna]|uniref:Methyltransferase domain-containing protein n=1 Tax=Achlya hypogyna TaxID=1202772 RepID=A0A1V9YAY6_ACHHY|nr:hypothetical protein ACHHYP_15388 [Achlya hypogyna]